MRFRHFLIQFWIAMSLGTSCLATTVTTRWDDLLTSVAAAIDHYAKNHEGKLPSDVESLFIGSTKAMLQDELGGPISSQVLYFPDNPPTLSGDSMQLLAVIAFPIEEDRRQSVGRYIVYRHSDGRIRSRWEAEDVIQAAAAKANVVIPYAPLYREKPLKVLEPDYGARLVENAVLKYGVPIEQAVKAVEKHVDDVSNRRAKAATTWAEIASAATPASRAVGPNPSPTMPPDATPRSTSDAKPSPLQAVEPVPRDSTWPLLWVAGTVAALAAIGLLVWKRRARS